MQLLYNLLGFKITTTATKGELGDQDSLLFASVHDDICLIAV
jgi:hypothetical protein